MMVKNKHFFMLQKSWYLTTNYKQFLFSLSNWDTVSLSAFAFKNVWIARKLEKR